MKNTKSHIKTKTEPNPVKEGDELSLDELDQVSGGFSLRDFDTVGTTDIDDDTKSKV